MIDRFRVMVIDDNVHDLELARIVFEEHDPPVDVASYDSGEGALTALRDPVTVRPHVILLDINMPVTSGFTVLRQIKEDPNVHHLPVVILTTSHNPADVALAYELGASAVMQKVPSFSAFEQQIATFLRFWLACWWAEEGPIGPAQPQDGHAR